MCKDGQPCNEADEASFAEALNWLGDRAERLDDAFAYALESSQSFQSVKAQAEATDKLRAPEALKKLVKQFFEAGALTVLAMQKAEHDHAIALEEMINDLPPEVQELLKKLGTLGRVEVRRV
jgi:hypothetical protein